MTGIKAIYDNGSKTFDRYTVVYDSHNESSDKRFWDCRGMSENPTHPQGYGIYGTCMLGNHLGEKITFEDLPEEVKQIVVRDLEN